MSETSETSETKPTGLYEAAIGEKNQTYYLDKFEQFDEKGDGLHVSWNWAALVGAGVWALYRKMYGWFFATWAVGIILNMAIKLNPAPAVGFLYLAPGLCFAIFGNSLYHRKVKAQIANAQELNTDEGKVIRRLNGSGGVHTWALYAFGAIPVIGIIAAIAIPAYQNKSKFDASTAKLSDATQAPVSTDLAKGVITSPSQAVGVPANIFDQFDKPPPPQIPSPISSVVVPTQIAPTQPYKPSKEDLQEIAKAKAYEMQAKANQVQVQVNSDLQAIADRAMRDYPYLDTPEGQKVLELITAKRDVYIRQGVYPSIALTRAVNDFAPAYAPQAERKAPRVVDSPAPAVPAIDSQGCGWVTPTEWKCKQ